MLLVFSAASFAGSDAFNILNKIEIEKPYDNHYQLNLYFSGHFQDNAFMQELKNGSFQVFIPNTKLASKKIKIIHKDKAHKPEVKIEFDNPSYAEDKIDAKYLTLAVNTPVNSDIELTAHTDTVPVRAEKSSYISIFSIISAALLFIIAILLASIFKALRSMNPVSKNYTAFPSAFLNSPDSYARERNGNISYEKPEPNIEINTTASEIDEFDGFELALFGDLNEKDKKTDSAVSNPITADGNKIEAEKEEVSGGIHEEKADSSSAENDENSGLIELISELKIGLNKGFYLTTADNDTYALFGYAGGSVFLLQKFDSLQQENIQAKFYNKKDNCDLYIVKLDSYRAMVSISDTEIKELAVL